MSALALELEQILSQESGMSCRFCQCTEEKPCIIAMAVNPDGTVRLARNDQEVFDLLPCSWYIPGVCNAPFCIEKLLAEMRDNVLLFDAQGHALPRKETA
ncbi:MAG TPA: hypothetical protein VFF58_00495 [Candidatus Nitrosotalea sp.]|nr:hypothetical protein [Candidatus Nitrosotalea sp.]